MKTIMLDNNVSVYYHCTIEFLDNSKLTCMYKSNDVGRDLLDHVCEHLHLEEKQFWGLFFKDSSGRKHWLKLEVLIRTQLLELCPVILYFRVKVYPIDPQKLLEEDTRDQMVLQLRHDLMNKAVICSKDEAAMLIALNLQITLGNYDAANHTGNYATEKILQKQTAPVEIRATEIHKFHLVGLNRTQTEDLFLRLTSQLASYGMDSYNVTDEKGAELLLGFNRKGVCTFLDNVKHHNILWNRIEKFTHKNIKINIHIVKNDLLTFLCASTEECDYIFARAIEHQVSFTFPCEGGSEICLDNISVSSHGLLKGDKNFSSANVIVLEDKSTDVSLDGKLGRETAVYQMVNSVRRSNFKLIICQIIIVSLVLYGFLLNYSYFIGQSKMRKGFYEFYKDYALGVVDKFTRKLFW